MSIEQKKEALKASLLNMTETHIRTQIAALTRAQLNACDKYKAGMITTEQHEEMCRELKEVIDFAEGLVNK